MSDLNEVVFGQVWKSRTLSKIALFWIIPFHAQPFSI